MLVLEACKHECVCASKFPHIHFLAYISLYLLLKVYIEGIPWGNLHSSTYIFPFSVHILHRCFCIPLIVFLPVSQLCLSWKRSLCTEVCTPQTTPALHIHVALFVHLQILVHLNTRTYIYQPVSVSSIASASFCELFCITLSFAAYPSVSFLCGSKK